MQSSKAFDVQADGVAEMSRLAQEAGGYLTLTRIGGLGLIPEEVVDGPVPGAAVEGVVSGIDEFENDQIDITFWTDGAMHRIVTAPGTEARVRIVIESDPASPPPVFPPIELCGRCNRHIVPIDAPHIGC